MITEPAPHSQEKQDAHLGVKAIAGRFYEMGVMRQQIQAHAQPDGDNAEQCPPLPF